MNWIPIEERLPKDGENVLVWDGDVWVDVYHRNGAWVANATDKYSLDDFTHWAEVAPPGEAGDTIQVPRELSGDDLDWLNDIMFHCDLGSREVYEHITNHFEKGAK